MELVKQLADTGHIRVHYDEKNKHKGSKAHRAGPVHAGLVVLNKFHKDLGNCCSFQGLSS